MAALAEHGVPPAQPGPGTDFYCCRPTVPPASLPFKRTPLQSIFHILFVLLLLMELYKPLAAWMLLADASLLPGFLGHLIPPPLWCQIQFLKYYCVLYTYWWPSADLFSVLSPLLP